MLNIKNQPGRILYPCQKLVKPSLRFDQTPMCHEVFGHKNDLAAFCGFYYRPAT